MNSFRRIINHAWLGKRYAVVEGKENAGYADTPTTHRQSQRPRQSGLSEGNKNVRLKRNSSLTQSMRDVVGTVRQKLRRSTRQRKRLHDSYTVSPVTGFKKRRHNVKVKRTPTSRGGYREVKMSSPFEIETPKSYPRIEALRTRQRWHDVETPTRLRKEVEDLTANMQALIALTPNTLMTRSQSRRQLTNSPLRNVSLRTRQHNDTPQIRRQIHTEL